MLELTDLFSGGKTVSSGKERNRCSKITFETVLVKLSTTPLFSKPTEVYILYVLSV